VGDNRDEVDQQNTANAQQGTVNLEVSPEDADILLKMAEAGLIDLDGQAEI